MVNLRLPVSDIGATQVRRIFVLVDGLTLSLVGTLGIVMCNSVRVWTEDHVVITGR